MCGTTRTTRLILHARHSLQPPIETVGRSVEAIPDGGPSMRLERRCAEGFDGGLLFAR